LAGPSGERDQIRGGAGGRNRDEEWSFTPIAPEPFTRRLAAVEFAGRAGTQLVMARCCSATSGVVVESNVWRREPIQRCAGRGRRIGNRLPGASFSFQ